MKKHSILTKSLAAIVAVTLAGQSAHAAIYIANDLLLGFRANGGLGADKDVVVNIGQASLYTGASSSFTVSTGTIANDLTTAFTTWNAHRSDGSNGGLGSDVIWSISGTSGLSAVGGDPAKTLYATRVQTSPAWNRDNDITQGVISSKMRAFATAYKNNYTVSGNGAVIQLKADTNSYASYQPGGTITNSGPTPGTSFAAFNPTAESSAAVSAVDLYRMPVGTGAGQFVGSFSLASDGTLSFTAASKPTLASPASNTSFSNTLALNFTLPSAANTGTLKVDFNNGTEHVLTLAASEIASGAHTFSFNPLNPTGSTSIASGSALPDGIYKVTVSYQDSTGRTLANLVPNSSVKIDNTAPVINTGSLAAGTVTSTSALPDLTTGHGLIVTDALSTVASITQNPPAGTILGAGTHSVSFTATDSLGNVSAPVSANITVDLGAVNNTVQLKSKFGVGLSAIAGTKVPGAGTLPGIPKGAVFTSYGVPSINDAGQIAFFASWNSPAVLGTDASVVIPAVNGKGIFTCTVSNPTPTLVAYTGGACGVDGAIFGNLMYDPVINEAGKVAFIANLANDAFADVPASPLIATSNDLVVITNAFTGGALTVAAREGSIVSSETDTPAISVVSGISLQGTNLLYNTVLKTGTGAAVTATNNKAAYINNNGTVTRVIRAGVNSLPGRTANSNVSAFTLLSAVAGSPGQTREHSGNAVTLRATLVDGTVTLVDSVGGVITPFKKDGDKLDGSTSAFIPAFASFGPSVMADGSDEVVNGTLTVSVPAGVTLLNNTGIFKGVGSTFTSIARKGDVAPGSVGNFTLFGEPLVSGGSFAFPATVKNGALAATNGIFWKKSTGSLAKVAIATDLADGAPVPSGAFASFTSLALTDNGPLFYGGLKAGTIAVPNGITAANDNGIWAVNSAGALVKIVMEGDTIASGKVVKAITFLTAVTGSQGVTHSFNNNRQITYLATFMDGTKGVVTSLIP